MHVVFCDVSLVLPVPGGVGCGPGFFGCGPLFVGACGGEMLLAFVSLAPLPCLPRRRERETCATWESWVGEQSLRQACQTRSKRATYELFIPKSSAG